MSDDLFLQRLRDEARVLRFEADDVTLTRLSARIRARITQPRPLSVADVLARWTRPLAFALGSLAIVATLGIYYEESRDQVSLEAAVTQTTPEVQMAGASLAND